MILRFSREVEEYLTKMKRKRPKEFALLRKQLILFESDPRHPSLRLHKLSGKLENVWSISVGKRLRMVYFVRDGGAWVFAIGTHDEVYR